MPSTGYIGAEADAAVMASPAYGAGLGNHLPIGTWGSTRYRSMMRFVPPAWASWTDIVSASLVVYTSDFQHVGPRNSQIYCRRTNMPVWTKGAGSQDCEGGFSAGNTTQWPDTSNWTATDQQQFASGTGANHAQTIDVTAMVKYYWQQNASRIVFGFDQVGGSDYSELWSHEKGGSYNPKLTITYVVQSPPDAPTQNLPAAGAASVTQTPTFTWSHSDPQGDPQSSASVRVWDAAGTTQVGTTQVVAGATASLVWPTALPRGVSYMWDVATADAANGLGAYSAKRAFSVKALPVVTVDATRYMVYSGGAPRLQVKWSVTGGTQYKYRVTCTGYDSGLLTSVATTHTLSTLALTNGTAVAVTVYVETADPLGGTSAPRSFTPRYGLTVHRRDLTPASEPLPTSWGTPAITQTVPAGASLVIEYGSNSANVAAPTAWYSTLSAVPKARYLYWRAWFIPSSTTGPTLDKIALPYSRSTEVVDKWSTTKDGSGLSGGYAIDTGEYVYGSRCLTNVVAGAGPYVCYSAAMQVRAGRSYILTGLMKSVGNSGAQFRLADVNAATIQNPDGTAIASIVTASPLVQTLNGDADWFTTDQRDVNRYATPVWVAPSDMTVYVILRAGGTAGAQAWWDGVKLEESSVATPWSPAAVGAVIVDAGGVQVDANDGGIFRLRGAVGGVRDVVQLGNNGLDFGGDVPVSSSVASELLVGGYVRTVRPSSGQAGYAMRLTGDAQDRLLLINGPAGGYLSFGDGTNAQDTTFYRFGAGLLQTDGHLGLPGGRLRLANVISPASLAANTNDWAPTGIANASMLRITTDATIRVISGIVAGQAGDLLFLTNMNAATAITLAHDITSAAANRFYCPNNANYTLNPRATVLLWYDASTLRWRVLA